MHLPLEKYGLRLQADGPWLKRHLNMDRTHGAMEDGYQILHLSLTKPTGYPDTGHTEDGYPDTGELFRQLPFLASPGFQVIGKAIDGYKDIGRVRLRVAIDGNQGIAEHMDGYMGVGDKKNYTSSAIWLYTR